MASLNYNQLRASSTVKSSGEAVPRQSNRPFLGNTSSTRQSTASQLMRSGENFNHLKLTAEKMMQEQASAKTDLHILKTKLQKSEDQVRTLETKLQDMNDENAMLNVKHKQDLKLWNGLNSKLLSTTTFCDRLAETLQLLDCQVQEADRSKTFLEEILAGRLKFFEKTECRLHELQENRDVAEKSVAKCEASNVKLQCTIQDMERTILSNTEKIKKLVDERDGFQQELMITKTKEEENRATIMSFRSKMEDLQNQVACRAKEATDLQHLNLTLFQGKGVLELEVKGLQKHVDMTLKDNEALRQELEVVKLKATDLEKANAVAAINNQNLITDKGKLELQSETAKTAKGKLVEELHQCRVKHEMEIEVIKTNLQEAIIENERLVTVLENKQSQLASLKDDVNRLYQERNEKSELVSSISQNIESLRRENSMIQEQLAAAEGVVESLEVKFDLELKLEQEESSRRLVDILQRHSQEIANIKRISEENMQEAVAEEKSKGDDAWKSLKQVSDECVAKQLEDSDKRWQILQEDCERRIGTIREGHEDEKQKMISTHSEELTKREAELQKVKMKITSIESDAICKVEEERRLLKQTVSKLREGYEQANKESIEFHAQDMHKMQEDLRREQDQIIKLRGSHQRENAKIVSIHSDEIQKLQLELEKMNETVCDLRDGHEQAKRGIVALHAQDMMKMQEDLRREQEKLAGSISELQDIRQKTADTGLSNRAVMDNLHLDYQCQLQKISEENSELHQALKDMQRAYEDVLVRTAQEHNAQFDRLERERQAQTREVQESSTAEITEWKSKAIGLEIKLKEALEQIATNQVLKEGKLAHIVNEDLNTTTIEEQTSKDIPTAIVTPIIKDKETQQPSQKLTVKRIIHLADTTDEDDKPDLDNQKKATKGKRQMERSPRPRKRKADVLTRPPEEPLRVTGRTSRRKGALDIHLNLKAGLHQAPTCSEQLATEEASSGNKVTSVKKDNEPHKKQLPGRQHSVPLDLSQRKTGFTCTQESDLHPMPGPTQDKERMIDSKRKLRKSSKDVSQELEKKRLTKDLSPAISDLFQMDGLVPYYQGDDPYAFD